MTPPQPRKGKRTPPALSASATPGCPVAAASPISARGAMPFAFVANLEAFGIERASRERPCDRNGARIPWPTCDEAVEWMPQVRREEVVGALRGRTFPAAVGYRTLWKVPYLTTAQFKRLERTDASAAVIHRALREARVEWIDRQWARVPEWGGIKRPGGEWGFSLASMTAWHEQMVAGKAVEVEDDSFDEAHERGA